MVKTDKHSGEISEERRGGERGEGGRQRQLTNILVSKTALQKVDHRQNRLGSGMTSDLLR